MHFKGLRLSGFKSFVEPTTLDIAPGLTGVVGPNGCGKSNLVEALRWAMGESSPKRMRGGEMDDVIFAGTNQRPARNLAEVTLVLDNSGRSAPSEFNDTDELEVTRRIERGMGSDYVLNSKAVRAKDVSLLFQDNGTGAHSAALVSQGRIGALIAAKPTERRLLLEEAAGITGLHARRHEAELKLRGAETNLTRLDDVLNTMDAQLQMLKKQARQATRYRNINTEVRRQEAMLLYLRWTALIAQIGDSEQAFKAAENKVAELMLDVTRFETSRTEAAAGLPQLRQDEAAAAAVVQRLNMARAEVDAEAARVEAALKAAQQRKAQAEGDIGREEALSEDARAALDGISEALAVLVAEDEASAGLVASYDAKAEETVAAREMAEAAVSELTGQVSTAEAEAASYARQISDLEARLSKAQARRGDVQSQRAQLEAEKLSDLFVAGALREAEAAAQKLAEANAAASAAEISRQQADGEVGIAREKVNILEGNRASLVGEQKAIERLLAASGGDYPPVLEKVEAARGYELALAAALGADLDLPSDAAAHEYWLSLPAYQGEVAWPAGVVSLAKYVQAPSELSRRLALIGVVETEVQAEGLAAQLQPGQCLVTREGAAWRWDGVTTKAGAPTVSAQRLQQRNRLAELVGEVSSANAAVEAEQHKLAEILSRSTEASQAVRSARSAEEAALAQLNEASRRAAAAEADLAAANTRLTGLIEAEERLSGEISTLTEEKSAAEAARANVPDVSAAKAQLTTARDQLIAAQGEAAEAEATRRGAQREAELRATRRSQLSADEANWKQRAEGALARLDELKSRVAAALLEESELSEKPAQLEAQRSALLSELSNAEEKRRAAADVLASAENSLSEVEKALRAAEHGLSDVREARARAQAEAGNLQQSQQALIERITEKCETTPENLPALAEIEEGQPLPEPEGVEARLAKLVHEREVLGPVNLRAEVEVEEQQTQINTMQTEKGELIEAIAKLRGAIGSINREARERLLSAFDTVNGHFKRLFGQLFGGGEASLKLTEADDPLEAGLEVLAQPPGKKLQNLTLLSGGEQALTSIALIFAVFLTHPSPICVLDEVDAPLDEANIDRYCTLLEHMAKEGTTRFLVITHQRLTMSRMHRLYGVTMMEKGVSKLVSVDLDAVEELRVVA